MVGDEWSNEAVGMTRGGGLVYIYGGALSSPSSPYIYKENENLLVRSSSTRSIVLENCNGDNSSKSRNMTRWQRFI